MSVIYFYQKPPFVLSQAASGQQQGGNSELTSHVASLIETVRDVQRSLDRIQTNKEVSDIHETLLVAKPSDVVDACLLSYVMSRCYTGESNLLSHVLVVTCL